MNEAAESRGDEAVPQIQLHWHEVQGRRWAQVVLDHPGKLNAMSVMMWRRLRAVFLTLASTPDLRAIVVQGQGGAFCAGGDISEYTDFRFEAERLRAFHEEDVWGGLAAMLACEVPIIASIAGPCMGAGVEIACCCDLRIAQTGATFGAPIAKLGFPMAPRELQLVRRLTGDAMARRMLLGAEVMTAPMLLGSGFLAQVVDDDALPQATERLVQRLLQLAPQAARATKRAMRALDDGEHAWQAQLTTAYDYAADAEHREGVTAFIEKRRPDL